MKLAKGKNVWFIPKPTMSGTTVYVDQPIRGIITEIKYLQPEDAHGLVTVTDKYGNKYTGYETQITFKYPAIYNFI